MTFTLSSLFAGNVLGTVFIDDEGAGVQLNIDKGDLFPGVTKWDGSTGVSGAGKFGPETLILGFPTSVDSSSVVLLLKNFELDEDVALELLDTGNVLSTIPYATIKPSAGGSVLVGDMLTIDFSNANLGIGATPLKRVSVVSGTVGTDNDHYFLNSVSAAPVPEPSAAVLFCVGVLLVGNTIRRQPRAR